ncbi:MAG TPA: DNA repair protein RadC [Vicinamibacterales bacterium]|jgi:DNA repair protein RadC
MKDVAPHDRPREKLERLGVAALGDNELLALVVGGGVRGCGALEMANRLIEFVGGLHNFTRIGAGDLRAVSGVGRARAAQVIAAVEFGRRTLVRDTVERPRFTSPGALAAYLLPLYGASAVEQFGLVMLDTKHRVIRTKIVSIGGLDATVVQPREVFREAAASAAAAIVLFHNHPSGDPTPSPDDFVLTSRMVHAGDVMGIDVIDHIVLADQSYYSLVESGSVALRRQRRAADKIDGT